MSQSTESNQRDESPGMQNSSFDETPSTLQMDMQQVDITVINNELYKQKTKYIDKPDVIKG